MTALNPVIGYDRATELAAEAAKTGRGILELIREKKILTEEQIAAGARSDGDDRPEPHVMRIWPAAPAAGLLAAATLVVSAAAGSPAALGADSGWRSFSGSWSASGRRDTLPTENNGVAALVRLSGAVVIAAGSGLTSGFRGEAIGFNDGHEGGPGPGRVDRRTRRPHLQLAGRRAARRRPELHGDDHAAAPAATAASPATTRSPGSTWWMPATRRCRAACRSDRSVPAPRGQP